MAAYIARLENDVSGLRSEVVVLKAKGGVAEDQEGTD